MLTLDQSKGRQESFFTAESACGKILSTIMKARAHIVVSGRVQGVFFRDHTQRWASSLGLAGWVRNLGDGRVEAVAEGEKEKIEDLIGYLKQGPPVARVEDVEVSWEEPKGEFSDFRVTRSVF